MVSDAESIDLFMGYDHGCNKIHSWEIPKRPLACRDCDSDARALATSLWYNSSFFIHKVSFLIYSSSESRASSIGLRRLLTLVSGQCSLPDSAMAERAPWRRHDGLDGTPSGISSPRMKKKQK